MYVPRATYSLSRSFWIVPDSAADTPGVRDEHVKRSRIAAVELIVIDVET